MASLPLLQSVGISMNRSITSAIPRSRSLSLSPFLPSFLPVYLLPPSFSLAPRASAYYECHTPPTSPLTDDRVEKRIECYRQGSLYECKLKSTEGFEADKVLFLPSPLSLIPPILLSLSIPPTKAILLSPASSSPSSSHSSLPQFLGAMERSVRVAHAARAH